MSRLRKKTRGRQAWDVSDEEPDMDDSGQSSDESDRRIKRREVAKPLKKRGREEPGAAHDSDASDGSTFRHEYDPEGYRDARDRAELALMREIDRERLLADRIDERQEARQKWELRRRARKSDRSGSKVGKNLRVGEKQQSALDRYKAERTDAKRAREERAKEAARTTSDYAPASPPKTLAAQAKRARTETEQPLDFTLADIEKTRLTRDLLEKWVDEPFFEQAVIGSFVRVGLGTNRETGQATYRMTRIKDVTEKHGVKPYTMVNKKQTNKYLVLSLGTAAKEFRVSFVSNSPFQQSEFDNWVAFMRKNRTEFPTKEDLEARQKAVEEAKNHVYTAAEVTTIVERNKSRRTHSLHPTLELAELATRRDEAIRLQDLSLVIQLNEQIAVITTQWQEQQRIASEKLNLVSAINQRNKTSNVTIKEDVEAAKKKKLENKFDPFSRKMCEPKIFVGIPKAAAAPAAAAPAPAAPTTAAPATAPVTPTAPKAKVDYGVDLMKAHSQDFDIDIDLAAHSQSQSIVASLPKKAVTLSKASSTGSKPKQLSLADYKKRA